MLVSRIEPKTGLDKEKKPTSAMLFADMDPLTQKEDNAKGKSNRERGPCAGASQEPPNAYKKPTGYPVARCILRDEKQANKKESQKGNV